MVVVKKRPARGHLMLVCAETGKEVAVGVIYSRDDLARAKPARLLLQCRHCGKSHIFKFSEARLKPIRR